MLEACKYGGKEYEKIMNDEYLIFDLMDIAYWTPV